MRARVCVYVCVCVRKRERGRQTEIQAYRKGMRKEDRNSMEERNREERKMKLGFTRVEPLMGLYSKDIGLLAMPANIILGCIILAVRNTPAYYGTLLITTVKCFQHRPNFTHSFL
jgi:hypothetical protein